MGDPRIAEQAKVIVNYSCKVKKGDTVLVLTGSGGIPLVREIAREVGVVGGQMMVILMEDSITRAYLLAADDETIQTLPEAIVRLFGSVHVLVQVLSTSNTKEMGEVPPRKIMLSRKRLGPINQIIERKRWNITLHPTEALAQEAGKSLEAFADFAYGAMLVDWPAMTRSMQVLADKMSSTKSVRIVGEDTDLTISISGRKPIIDSGERNLPGGEVFTSPIEDSASGKIYFDKPITFSGREIRGARLTFKDGVVTESRAETGLDILDALLSTDEGARRLGELGIGMNRGIIEFSKNILFDEKMGDTIHMALGLGFEQAGGRNKSGIHLDMIKGMKGDGTIYFDAEPIYANGRFSWE